MPSSKRKPEKQRRSQQNRSDRAARAARSARAGEATAISRGEREPAVRPVVSAEAGKGAKGSTRSRRPSPFTVPGQRAVFMSLLFAVVSAGTLLFAPVRAPRDVPPDDPRIEDESPEVNEDGTVTIFEDVKLLEEEGTGVGLFIMVTPIVICGAAVAVSKKRQRSWAWTMAMIALSAFVFFGSRAYGLLTLPSLVALAVGGFQSRRVESRQRIAEIRANRAERETAAETGSVIDVEPVED